MLNDSLSADKTDTQKFLAQEWNTLQNQFDSYEKHALFIKLFAIAWLITCFILSQLNLFNICVSVLVCGVIWLQDAIWKTFQSRIETRLLKIEEALAQHNKLTPCQFNRDFYEQRAGTLSTLVSYLKQAIRPTIAYPHVVIVGIILGLYLL